LLLAIEQLDTSDADVKIVVLLSDGEPTLPQDTTQWCDNEDATENPGTYSYPEPPVPPGGYPRAFQSWSGFDACVAEAVDELIDNHDTDLSAVTTARPEDNILFYSAAVTTSSNLKGYMAHLSSNECVWAQTTCPIGSPCPTPSVRLQSDCNGDYAYSGSSAAQIASMYSSIVDSIIGSSVTLLSATDSSTLQVTDGQNVELPLPPGFVCQSAQQTIPIRNTFYGTGTVEFSNLRLEHCAYE
jgi:hypothetical protein